MKGKQEGGDSEIGRLGDCGGRKTEGSKCRGLKLEARTHMILRHNRQRENGRVKS